MSSIEERLAKQQFAWLSGKTPGTEDREEFEKVEGVPSARDTPNLFAWYCLVSRFSGEQRATWGVEKKVAPVAKVEAQP
jgi:hypothetical protein